MVRSRSNLLIRRKAQANPAMPDFRMGQQILGSGHNLCYPCLVIRPQKSGAIGYDQVFTLKLLYFRKILHPEHNVLRLVQYNVLPIIMLHNTRLHTCSAHRRGCIHMSNKAKGNGILTAGRCRNGSIDIAMFPVISNLRCTHGLQLLHQQFCKLMLFCSAWGGS